MLTSAGFDDMATSALMDLDSALFQWNRMALKGEFPGQILAQMDTDLELGQFHALTAVTRIVFGIGRDAPEQPTIGLLAEEMNIDPSRASRVASDLIARGYLRRDAAQEDGRKSILVMTDKARDLFDQFRIRKWEKLIAMYSTWTSEEISCFARLVGKYMDGIRRS